MSKFHRCYDNEDDNDDNDDDNDDEVFILMLFWINDDDEDDDDVVIMMTVRPAMKKTLTTMKPCKYTSSSESREKTERVRK